MLVSNLNEIYDFDEDKPEVYKPDRVENDLKEILLEKVDGSVRIHIDLSNSIVDIHI